MSTPAIVFESLALKYGAREIIAGFTGEIATGEFVAILGPNGAGKSTLIKALLGLLPPAAGRIEILGGPPRRGNTRIGYLPQMRSHAAATSLSGRAYLHAVLDGHRWGAEFFGTGKIEAVHAALHAVDAEAFVDRPYDQLSGGERQRLALAQALLGDPEILLLDEPLLNLDPRRQGELIAIVDGVRRRRRVTVLFVGHDINPLLPVVDRVLYLAGGTAALGSVAEVINPATLSRLYRTEMKVFPVEDMLFIMAADHRTIEHGEHFH